MKLDCIDVSKRFGSVTALDRLNLHLEDQRIHGLLGRNGAGKTTLLRMIGNLIQPSDGQLLWEGKPLWENPQAQQQIFLSTERSWFSELNANEIVRWMKRSYPNFSSEQFFAWAKRFELNCKTPNLKLSTGYRSVLRALLALSIHTPLLLLDEPTLGMDAFHRELFYKLLIESYTESPSCILLSTHLISEVEGLLERVTIIDHGKLLVDEEVETLLEQGYCVSGRIAEVDDFCADKRVIGSNVVGGLKTSAILGKQQIPPASLDISGLSLQQLFVQLVGSAADEDDPATK